MATTEEILKAAGELGELIAEHDASKKLEDAAKRLEADVEAQRLLADNQRLLMALMQKQQQGQQIDLNDQQKLNDLQQRIVMNPALRSIEQAQVDLTDLIRRVDDAIDGATPDAADMGAAPGGAPGGAAGGMGGILQ